MIKNVLKPAYFCEVCEKEITAPDIAIMQRANGQEMHFCKEHFNRIEQLPEYKQNNFFDYLFNQNKKIEIATGEIRTVKI